MEKDFQRKHLRSIIKSLARENVAVENKLIEKAFLNSSFFPSCNIFLSYFPLKSEVNVLPINMKILQSGKSLYLPKCGSNGEMFFYKIENNRSLEEQCSAGLYGIMEPKESLSLFIQDDFGSSEELGQCKKNVCVIVPGLGFDPYCNRIGRGKGYYDRYLSRLEKWSLKSGMKIIKVGVCFSCQLVPLVETEPTDMKMDYVISGDGRLISGCPENSI